MAPEVRENAATQKQTYIKEPNTSTCNAHEIWFDPAKSWSQSEQ